MKSTFLGCLLAVLSGSLSHAQQEPEVIIGDGQIALVEPLETIAGETVFSGTVVPMEAVAMNAEGISFIGGVMIGFIAEKPPVLSIRQEGTELVVSWAIPSVLFVLQAAEDLSDLNTLWTSLAVTPLDQDGRRFATFPMTDSPRFFRLIKEP